MVRGMTQILSSRFRLRSLKLPALVAAAALLVSGCSASWDGDLLAPGTPGSTSSEQFSDGPQTGESGKAASGAHEVTLTMTGQTFTFSPTTCVNNDGDLTVSGPGVDDADNTPMFLDIDIGEVDGWPSGKAHIYFFAENPAPTDVFFVGEVGSGDDYSMGHMLDGYELEVFFRNHDAVPTGDGTFVINCG